VHSSEKTVLSHQHSNVIYSIPQHVRRFTIPKELLLLLSKKVKITILRSIILIVIPQTVDVRDRRIETVREQDVLKLFES